MKIRLRHWLRKGEGVIIYLVEDVRFYTYLLIFSFVVLGLGWVYAALTPLGEGMGQNSQALNNATFFQGLYFSVVTVSSLGYGDLHPIGVYIIWHGGSNAATVYVGQGYIRDRLSDHRTTKIYKNIIILACT